MPSDYIEQRSGCLTRESSFSGHLFKQLVVGSVIESVLKIRPTANLPDFARGEAIALGLFGVYLQG